jgi:hypothetical protein
LRVGDEDVEQVADAFPVAELVDVAVPGCPGFGLAGTANDVTLAEYLDGRTALALSPALSRSAATTKLRSACSAANARPLGLFPALMIRG